MIIIIDYHHPSAGFDPLNLKYPHLVPKVGTSEKLRSEGQLKHLQRAAEDSKRYVFWHQNGFEDVGFLEPAGCGVAILTTMSGCSESHHHAPQKW